MNRHEILSKEFHQLKTGIMIRCRYYGATDHKGPRIKATIVRDSEYFISKIHDWDYSINHNENYLVSAQYVLMKWNDYRRDGIPEIENAVIPKPGRAVIFDGFITHAAREISRSCIELRMVATLKYERQNV